MSHSGNCARSHFEASDRSASANHLTDWPDKPRSNPLSHVLSSRSRHPAHAAASWPIRFVGLCRFSSYAICKMCSCPLADVAGGCPCRGGFVTCVCVRSFLFVVCVGVTASLDQSVLLQSLETIIASWSRSRAGLTFCVRSGIHMSLPCICTIRTDRRSDRTCHGRSSRGSGLSRLSIYRPILIGHACLSLPSYRAHVLLCSGSHLRW